MESSRKASERSQGTLSNAAVARVLEEVADLLELQRANQYRVQAYRGAAQTIRREQEPIVLRLEREGLEGLDRLPGIGPAIARVVRELVTTGRLAMLQRLRGEHDPVAVLASVAGIGPTLARRLHETHEIDTLEQLELAAHDGRLERIPGFGPKRVAGIRDTLAGRLGRYERPDSHAEDLPSVAELLDVDREYRDGATAGTLPRIAPSRFNPTGEAWLPVLHTSRGDRHYTALFSNTALAHKLERTHDWLVMYFDGRDREHQCTIVTARVGPLAGRRVVRGREAECIAHYHLGARSAARQGRASHRATSDAFQTPARQSKLFIVGSEQ